MNRTVLSGVLIALGFLPIGCHSSYTLRGRAVEGEFSMLDFVGPHDEMLASPGIANAEVRIWRDPTRPNRSLVATERSRSDGGIAIPLSAFGAGWMEEQWLIEVVRPGYDTVSQLVTLPSPGSDERLLVILAEGASVQPTMPENLWEEYERYR